jgi:hypothetical protein
VSLRGVWRSTGIFCAYPVRSARAHARPWPCSCLARDTRIRGQFLGHRHLASRGAGAYADRTYQKLVRHLVGLRGVCGHLRGCRAVAIIFPQLNVGLVGPESTFERIGPPTRHFDGGRRENAVAANRPLLLITSGLRSRRDSADLSLSQKYTAPVQWSATVDRGLEAWRRAPAYH